MQHSTAVTQSHQVGEGIKTQLLCSMLIKHSMVRSVSLVLLWFKSNADQMSKHYAVDNYGGTAINPMHQL